MTPDRKLYKLIQFSNRITIERILNSTPDKEIAVSVLYLSYPERNILFSYLSAAKRERVNNEIRRSPQVKYNIYKTVIEKLIMALESGKKDDSPSGYFKPAGR